MARKPKYDHEALISHFNSEIKAHSVIRLADINKLAGGVVTGPQPIRDATNPISAHIASRIESGELTLLHLNTAKGPRSFVVESELSDAIAMANYGNRKRRLPPMVTILRSMAKQGASKRDFVILQPSRSKATAYLIEQGLLEHVRPSDSQLNAPKSHVYGIYRIKNRARFSKLLRAVKRVMELQGAEVDWE